MRTRTAAHYVLAIALFALGLSGCGQKGPLVPPKVGNWSVIPAVR